MRLSAATLPNLLKILIEQPSSARELIEATGLGHDGVHLFCQSMHEQGLVHIVWWDYHDSQYIPVYAFGPGQDVTERWSATEQALFKIFGNDLLSRNAYDLAKDLNLHTATLKKALNALTSKGYLVRNKAPTPNSPVTWRRNPHVALPLRRGAAGNAPIGATTAPATAHRPRPTVPQQTWFSAITG